MAHIEHDKYGNPYISNNWILEDVESACSDMEVTLNHNEKCDVLHQVANSFDANFGINWEYFYSAIQDQINARKGSVK